ncbi:carboxypeptidase-like regulatory domain-containing protein [Hyalangium sp.]|uniref:carboxypeptidase-like regulatory domain-containing protein n=1 Tax=Hyalangium sp. TaxID=2028555 RepID=UPI002D23B984|nr:carboxypeptidase-like regulatory domain-containing protein [Hyalangium sp.]HYI02099.1 carboxypeptidase-like regulatory domain-containing protein [Hyalangium sp.]
MVKRIVPVLLSLLVVACGDDKECKLDDPTSCAETLACEKVSGQEKPLCFAPVQVEGKVFDLASGAAVANAEVTALDANGAPVSGVAVSGVDGRYALRIPTERSDDKGTPVGARLTLRAGAQNYEPFPSGVRVALPLDTSGAASAGDDKPWAFSSAQTDVGLSALQAADQGRPAMSGTVEVTAGQSALVVVEGNGKAYSAVADTSGKWKVFNVAPGGGYRAQAYVKGANYTPAEVSVQQGVEATGIAIRKAGASTATLSGTVNLVAGANGAGTSVVMVVESTFNEALIRGEVPPGLRAPDPGTAPNISGAYAITGVPDGKYVVLAAFENDGNVRDPDPNISGTQIAHITVENGTPSASPSFKVTGAIQMVGPGGGETTEEVSGTPRFTWMPYSSAKSYELRVFDSQGTKVWENLSVLDAKNPSGYIEVVYGGPALIPDRIYQWRATAKGNALNPISNTEELRGLFTVK